MTPTIDELLKDTGETDAVDDAAKTPTPADLERLANEPTTMLWTLRLVQRSSAHCWVKTWVRRFRITIAFALGALAALQIGGLFAMRAMLRETIRTSVEEVLKERRIISGLKNQNPATGPVVAKLVGGAL